MKGFGGRCRITLSDLGGDILGLAIDATIRVIFWEFQKVTRIKRYEYLTFGYLHSIYCPSSIVLANTFSVLDTLARLASRSLLMIKRDRPSYFHLPI